MSVHADTVSMLQLGDVHYPAAPGQRVCDRDPDARLRTVLEASSRVLDRIDLLLRTGDQTHHGSELANRRLRDLLASMGAPIAAVPGSRDEVPSHRSVFGAPAATDVGAWRVLGWDSSVPGHDQDEWTPARSRGGRPLDERPTLVALHHPPVAPTNDPVFQPECAADRHLAVAARERHDLPPRGRRHDKRGD